MALALSLPAPLAAQTRGAVGVTARVLSTRESREALDVGWNTLAAGFAAGRTSLAAVRISPFPMVAVSTGGLRRPRPLVLRIDFLRN